MFFQIYTLQNNWFGKSSDPGFSTILSLSLNVLIFMVILYLLVSMFFHSFPDITILDKSYLLIFMAINIGAHYFIFIHNNNYEYILNYGQDKYSYKDSYALLISYGPLALLFIVFIFYWFLGPKH